MWMGCPPRERETRFMEKHFNSNESDTIMSTFAEYIFCLLSSYIQLLFKQKKNKRNWVNTSYHCVFSPVFTCGIWCSYLRKHANNETVLHLKNSHDRLLSAYSSNIEAIRLTIQIKWVLTNYPHIYEFASFYYLRFCQTDSSSLLPTHCINHPSTPGKVILTDFPKDAILYLTTFPTAYVLLYWGLEICIHFLEFLSVT